MSVLLRKSIADVTKRKGRAILMILGIFIGVLGLTAVNVTSDMMGSAFAYGYDPNAIPDMTFDAPAIPTTFSNEIAHLPTVGKIQVRTIYQTSWLLGGNGNNTVSMFVSGYTDWQHIQIQSMQLVSGRWPTASGEIAMDVSDETLQNLQPGDHVVIDKPDGSTVTLHIVGIVHSAGQFVNANNIQSFGYMDAGALQQLAPADQVGTGSRGSDAGGKGDGKGGISGAMVEMQIKATDQGSVRALFNTIQQKFTTDNVTLRGAGFRDPASQSINPQVAINGLLDVIRALALIALVLVCMMIINMVTMLLTEQIKVIGTMKAIGGTQGIIMRSYLLSVSIYAVIGTVLGVSLGLIVGYQLALACGSLAQVYVGPFQTTVWVVLLSIATGLLIPLLAALFPLWTGTRITVHEAISTHGVHIVGRQIRPHRLSRRLTWVPQTVQLGLRSVLRKPGRAALTLLALTLSGAVFMGVQITSTSLGATVYHDGDVFTRDDLSIDLGPGGMATQSIIASLRSLQNVSRIDPAYQDAVTTSKGSMQLVALPANSPFYQSQLLAGRWLRTNETNALVLSDMAAQQLNAHVDDHITVSQGSKHVSWQVVGIVHDVAGASAGGNPTGPIGISFTTLNNLDTALKHVSNDTAQELLVRATDNSLNALLQLRDQINGKLADAGIQKAFVSDPSQAGQKNGGLLIVYALFYAVAVLVALAGLLGLSNTLTASVLEQRLEIGILRSLGATGRKVGVIFWVEGFVLALISWGLGVLLGIPGGYLLLHILSYFIVPFDVLIDPTFILITLLFVVAVSFIASIGPVLGASRLRIRELLRYE
jgi:putative ABC transport system permease protein